MVKGIKLNRLVNNYLCGLAPSGLPNENIKDFMVYRDIKGGIYIYCVYYRK